MAVYIAAADGNLSDAAAVWATVDATSLLYAVNANTALTTSYVESAAFTPGAIPIDGIAVHVASRAASPTGTISIRLAQAGVLVAGTEVTINVSDLDRPGGTGVHSPGLYFFKFAAPVLLVAATAYTVSAKTSSATQVNLYRNATAGNWSRLIRTTTLGNPGAGDDWHVLGEWTAAATKTNRAITMDETAAVDYGSGATDLNLQGVSVGKGGTLSFGVAASTNYVLQMSTGMRVWAGGIFNIGTVGAEIPRTSTATLQFDCAADVDFGLLVDGTFIAQGLSRTAGKNIVQVLLNTDEAAAQTVLGIGPMSGVGSADPGWLTGDIIDIASTTRTFSQSEQRTLASDATTTTLEVTAGLTNAHSGTSPTQAEVILLTRNVIVRSVSTSAMSFVAFGDTATIDCDWVWFRYLGSATNYKLGVQVRTQSGGTCAIDFCAVSDFEGEGIYIGGTSIVASASVTVNNTVFASRQAATIGSAFTLTQTTGSGLTFSNLTVTAIDGSGGGRTGFTLAAAPNAVYSGFRAAGCEGQGFSIDTPTSTADILCGGTMSDFHAHSCAGIGLSIAGNFANKITGVQVWRNNTAGGLDISGPGLKEIIGGQIFGNVTPNVRQEAASYFIGRNLTIAADTTFSVATGFDYNGSNTHFFTILSNCSLGVVSGIFTAHTQDISFGGGRKEVSLVLVNTTLASATELLNFSVLQGSSVIRYQRVDGATNVHKSVYINGTVEYDAVNVRTTGQPTEKMSPVLSFPIWPLRNEPRAVNVVSGEQASFEIFVKKDSSYNGGAPRLKLLANPAIGETVDRLLATHSAVADTWQKLSGMSVAATESGVVHFVVEVDGTAGSAWAADADGS